MLHSAFPFVHRVTKWATGAIDDLHASVEEVEILRGKPVDVGEKVIKPGQHFEVTASITEQLHSWQLLLWLLIGENCTKPPHFGLHPSLVTKNHQSRDRA